MEAMHKYRHLLEKTFKNYPEFLTSQHLVKLGLFPSLDAVYLARARNMTPPFIKLKRKVLYSKNAVIEWCTQKTQTNIPKNYDCHDCIEHQEK